MDDGRTGLVVLLLAAPEVLEGAKRRQDGSADPDAVLPLGGSNDLDLGDVRITVNDVTERSITFMLLGAKAVISLVMRSAIPGNMVVPPDITIFP